MSKLFKTLLITFAMATVVGCSINSQEKKLAQAPTEFGTKTQDIKLNLQNLYKLESSVWKIDSELDLRTEDFFQMLEALMILGDKTGEKTFRKIAHRFIKEFYASEKTSTKAYPHNSLYLEAALGEKKKVLINLLEIKKEGLEKTPQALQNVVNLTRDEWQKLLSQAGFYDMPDLLINYIEAFPNHLLNAGALKDVTRAFRKKLQGEYRPKLGEFKKAVLAIHIENSLRKNLDLVFWALSQLPLNEEEIKELKLELNKANEIENLLSNSQDATQLSRVLYAVWLILDEKERENVFKKENADLYEFLSSLTVEEVKLLKDKSYHYIKNPILSYGDWKVTRTLEKLGVKKTKERLEDSINEHLVLELDKNFRKNLMNLPEIIGQLVSLEVALAADKLKKAQEDIRGFFSEHAINWGKENIFKDQEYCSGLEAPRVKIKLDGNAHLKISSENQNVTSTTSAAIGAAITVTKMRLDRIQEFEGVNYSDQYYYRIILSLLNKLPALGGFTQIDDTIYPSFFVVSTGNPFSHVLDIKKISDQKAHFVLPDNIALKPPYTMDKLATMDMGLQVSPLNQAHVLKGLSQFIKYFKDWEINGFDYRMGNYVLGDILEDVPAHLINERLFPKVKLYEYGIAISTILLESLLKEHSGLVFISPQNEILNGAQLDEAIEKRALSAAIVPVIRGQKVDLVTTTSLTEFIMALDEFLDGVEGVEKTSSTIIQEVKNGERPLLKKIEKARSDIKLLMLALGNFITNKLKDSRGLIRDNYSIGVLRSYSQEAFTSQQVDAIRALLRVYKHTKTDVYKFAALDIYYALNKYLWNDKQGSYKATTGFSQQHSNNELSPQTILQLALMLNELTPHLSDESRAQAQTIFDAIMRGLLKQFPLNSNG